MSESPWGDESAPPPKKKSVPTWAWWVGGGCLFLVLLVAVSGFFFVRFVNEAAKEWKDPEKQWASLKEVLPYDERPEGVTIHPGFHLIFDTWVFDTDKGLFVLIMRMPPSNPEAMRQQMLDPSAGHGVFGKAGRHGQEPITVNVQGRELHGLRFVQEGWSGNDSGEPRAAPGATILIDLTGEDADRALFLQMTRNSGSEDPLDEQDVIDFLKPFHVGPDR